MATVGILFMHYGPYHFSRLAAFQKLGNNLRLNVVGIELSRFQNKYPWGTSPEKLDCNLITVINNKSLEQAGFLKINYQTLATVSNLNPDIVAVAGYAEFSVLLIVLWAKIKRKKVILLSASKENDAPRPWWKEKIKSFILKCYDAALVGGKPQKRYLEKLGMSSDTIFTGYNVVGNENFHPDKIKSLAAPYQKSYFLAINRFVPKKNLSRLISAYAEYRKSTSNEPWDLILCGDGELRCQVEQQITELGLEKYIYLPGFLQQTELLPYFAHASCFIHASTQEQWGLVVNEAMAAGLPVLVSNRCGCFEDLIIEGVNGFGFNPEDTQQLTNLMLKVTSGNIDLEQIGQAALNHIQKFSPDYFAQGLKQAIEYAFRIS